MPVNARPALDPSTGLVAKARTDVPARTGLSLHAGFFFTSKGDLNKMLLELEDVDLAQPEVSEEELAPITRASKAEREAAKKLTQHQARFLVDLYYQTQRNRIAAAAQIREAAKAAENPAAFTPVFTDQYTIEKKIATQLGLWAAASTLGRWAQSICGIGPVMSAGLMAHIDIKKAGCCSGIWRFAGLDPSLVWGKGQKRPFNMRLKTLCAFKIGESFVKVQNRPADFYGHLFAAFKTELVAKNDAGGFAALATTALQKKKYGAETVARAAYESGKLPAAHVHAMARRRTVKLFLSHYYEVAYEIEFGQQPPQPYAFAHLGHVHKIAPPNWPLAAKAA
jgi:hypothetical protein